ncbi:MAG: zinc-dependent metalloprotease [Micrococcales bacterium]|nr:zinc-dependent metalloprotease [Micrococcales bacterium]
MSAQSEQPQGTPQVKVDWQFAKQTGRRLAPAGPQISAAEAAEVVESIRRYAAEAVEPIARTSGLRAPGDAPPVMVVDRPTWMAVNIDSMSKLMDPVIEKLSSRPGAPAPSEAMQAIGGKITGAEVGALLSFMSSKVLGQYDLAPEGTPKLMLVAPNLVAVERELEVDPRDFRLWVCMHEETHRVQFTAVPWLRQYMIDSSRELMGEMTPSAEELPELIQRIVKRLPEALGPGGGGLGELFATPEQLDKIARITAIMSLLEGHADVMMDEVGPQVIPSVEEIRRKFNERRKGAGNADRLLRRLLGLEAKMRQYRDGAAFVRGVIDEVGLDGFNKVWTSPETLPLPAEILDPKAWVARVHGADRVEGAAPGEQPA